MSLPTLRAARGLSQTELAAAAGVSRSLVAAVEAGRNIPSVDAALRLAAALHTTVEALFAATPDREPAIALDPAIREGHPVRLARVGGRLLAIPAPPGTLAAGIWHAAGVVATGPVASAVVAGCDPALALVERLSPDVLWLHASSAQAKQLLKKGLITGAVVHGPRRTGAIPITRWSVGVAATHALGSDPFDRLAAGELPLAQRDAAASTQQALERTVGRVPGPTTHSHHEAALVGRAIGAALTIEPVALEHGMTFHGLESHLVTLITEDERLAELLTSAPFRRQLAARPGYERVS